MFAMASAAEKGAKVIGIDRYAVGTGVREGFAALNSRYQQKYGTKIDKFDFITIATQAAAVMSTNASSQPLRTVRAKS